MRFEFGAGELESLGCEPNLPNPGPLGQTRAIQLLWGKIALPYQCLVLDSEQCSFGMQTRVIPQAVDQMFYVVTCERFDSCLE